MTGLTRTGLDGWDRERAVAAKAGRTITLCFPCRNEASTIGDLVGASRRALVDEAPLVDELVVIDDRSVDGTAAVAAAAGATVVSTEVVHALHGAGSGKGNALWASLLVTSGDLVVWCDGDVTSYSPDWVVRLVGPLLLDDRVALVKPSYRRPTDGGGGGRTTELTARPLLRLLAPELADLAQPLAGEYAARRSVIEQLPIPQGWGVEIAMILDVWRHSGVAAIAEVDLGERRHRHHPLTTLGSQATEVMAAVFDRLGIAIAADGSTGEPADPDTRSRMLDRPPAGSVRRP